MFMNNSILILSHTDTYPIRNAILRPGQPITSCKFTYDDLESTLHLGYCINNQIVGVCSYYQNYDASINQLTPHTTDSCYQLRGMAVLKQHQGKGIGQQLLNHGEQLLINKAATSIWFNARETALTFYTQLNYQIVSNPFNIINIGTHYKMYKNLTKTI